MNDRRVLDMMKLGTDRVDFSRLEVSQLAEEVVVQRKALREILAETDFPQDEPQSRWVRAVSRIQNKTRAALDAELAS